MLKIGIVGCGAIGSSLAIAVTEQFKGRATVSGLHDVDHKRAVMVAERLAGEVPILSLDALTQGCDLVVEATAPSVSGEIARKALIGGKDVMVLSVGGLIDTDVFELAAQNNCRVYIPSGAICGLDGVKGALMDDVSSITLTTRKPPAGLQGAPYVESNRIDLRSLREDTVIFEGSAREAIEGFPKNINASVALSFAGLGVDKTRVRIVCSPNSTTNVHEVEVEGRFGKLTSRTENVPAPENPRTSYMAVLSAIATLKGILGHIRVGT